jgi:hypothetical protein
MTTTCANVSIKYQGNGTQKIYSFPFTYLSWEDVEAFLYDETNRIWVNQKNKFIRSTATSLEFLTPPPASSIDNIFITRNTDLQSMLATYYPGSSIRAQDLNDDFDQLRLAIQESKCDVVELRNNLGNDFVEKNAVFDREDQEAGKWSGSGDQEYLATTGAIAAREDTIVDAELPLPVNYQQPGKGWMNTEECWASYWNPVAESWVAYVNTGPRGVPGQDGTNGTNGATGAQGPTGPQGPVGEGINVTGYIDVPGPPADPGTGEGQFIIDSNGHGWFWETDSDPAAWVDTGSIQGPQGVQGNPGTNGNDGAAATVTVDNTITGVAGSPANVVNIGTSSAAVLNFTIPEGARGPKGDSGEGILDSVTSIAPIVVNNTDAANPVISLNIALLSTLP